MKIKEYGKIFGMLLWADLVILSREIRREIIDMIFWGSLTMFVYGYIMPGLGLASSFGIFVLVGSIPSMMIFQAVNQAAALVSDLEERKSFLFYFTVPIPSWLIFVKYAISVSFYTVPVSLLLFPLGKILLWNQVHFPHACWIKFFLHFIAGNLLLGFCALWIASWVKRIMNFGIIWSRFVFPLWWLGGYIFSWQVLFNRFPYLAYLDLLNPITYLIEGMRASLLGQQGYLNFWLCFFLTIFFSLVIGARAIVLFKRRLDCA